MAVDMKIASSMINRDDWDEAAAEIMGMSIPNWVEATPQAPTTKELNDCANFIMARKSLPLKGFCDLFRDRRDIELCATGSKAAKAPRKAPSALEGLKDLFPLSFVINDTSLFGYLSNAEFDAAKKWLVGALALAETFVQTCRLTPDQAAYLVVEAAKKEAREKYEVIALHLDFLMPKSARMEFVASDDPLSPGASLTVRFEDGTTKGFDLDSLGLLVIETKARAAKDPADSKRHQEIADNAKEKRGGIAVSLAAGGIAIIPITLTKIPDDGEVLVADAHNPILANGAEIAAALASQKPAVTKSK